MTTSQNLLDTLQAQTLLAGFRPDHLEKLASMASEARFGRNELIFHDGDESSLFYLLVSGSVALEVPTPGRTVRITTLAQGEELGWSSLLAKAHVKQFQARALEDVYALAFDGERLRHACEEDYAFGYALFRAVLQVVAHRVQATRVQLTDIYSPVGSKL